MGVLMVVAPAPLARFAAALLVLSLMQKERAALEQRWQPSLDGKMPFAEALRNLVRLVKSEK